MKTKKLLLSLALLLSAFAIKAQCFVTGTHNVISPCQIQFYATGSGVYTFDWDFGDATAGTGWSTTHNYTSNGTYTVCVVGNDATGAACDTFCFPVTISGCSGSSCTIYTTYNTVSPCQLQFYVTGGPAGYSWDFGDGVGTATGTSPSYTYTANGTYTVCCIGYDTGGMPCDTSCFPVTISGCTGASCTIYGTYTTINPCLMQFTASGPGVSTVSWDFGDGGTATGNSPTHTYSANGTYTACAIGYDSGGLPCDTTCFPVTVSGCVTSSCTIYTTYNTVSACQIQFYVTGGPAGYSWNYGDGVGTGTGVTPTYTYTANGTYTVCCVGLDGSGAPCDTSCFPVTISGCVSGLNEYSNTAEVDLYPNPANNMINIDAGKLNLYSYKVFDIAGKLIGSDAVSSATFTINLNEMDAGIYGIMLYGKEGRLMAAKRFVKNK